MYPWAGYPQTDRYLVWSSRFYVVTTSEYDVVGISA